eukprot:CAMPEP_0203658672 /NCGR_PEP_ID=MMETSP0088-20131115/49017_1 /ASSEMBLY_ACC=CAM_ASM_001087 /TAXON_ID=426623 /ORGANISM="Chaetoceros affinis, Strain CCMP159" /LENGTH=31 /DNA_ID= /DNA_START= /DNA_END= /DNA_ORIENTATION=
MPLQVRTVGLYQWMAKADVAVAAVVVVAAAA